MPTRYVAANYEIHEYNEFCGDFQTNWRRIWHRLDKPTAIDMAKSIYNREHNPLRVIRAPTANNLEPQLILELR